MLHAGAWDKPGLKNDLVSVTSAWLELSASSDSGLINLYWADRLYGHSDDDDHPPPRSLTSRVLTMSLLVSQKRQMSPGTSQCHRLGDDHSHHMYVYTGMHPYPFFLFFFFPVTCFVAASVFEC